MASTPQYQCTVCGTISVTKPGICPNNDCLEMDAYEPYVKSNGKKNKVANKRNEKPVGLRKAVAKHISKVKPIGGEPIMTGIQEFDIVTGGLRAGSIIALGGYPGVGKSTLMMAVSLVLSHSKRVLYVSYEENEDQVKGRADLVGIEAGELYLVYENDVREIIGTHRTAVKPDIIIIDSLNHLIDPELNSVADSPSQMKHCESLLQQIAKSTGIIVILISQVNAAGDIKGQQSLTHAVDVVMYMETDDTETYRLLRCSKHRFHNTDNVGVFAFTDNGFEQVLNPSAEFLSDRDGDLSGSAVTAIAEGRRPMLREVVALTTPSSGGNGIRSVSGFDRNRALQIAATLENTGFISLEDWNLWVQVVGGVRIVQTSTDLALACAIFSAWHDIPVPDKTIAIGEIILNGRVKRVARMQRLLQEAHKMGFSRAVVPSLGSIVPPEGMVVIEVDRLPLALKTVFNHTDFDAIREEK